MPLASTCDLSKCGASDPRRSEASLASNRQLLTFCTYRSSRIDLHNWVKGLDGVVDQAQTAIKQILEMDWIKLAINNVDIHCESFSDQCLGHSLPHLSVAERRLMEVARIRQIYIPELVFRLHSMLYSSREVLPK